MSRLPSNLVCSLMEIVGLKKVLISIVILSALLSSTQLTASQSDKISAGAKSNNSSGESNIPEPNTGFAAIAVGRDQNVAERTKGVGQYDVPEPNLRGDVFAQQINQLESQRTEPNLPADKTKDAVIVERLRERIQEKKDAIELDGKRIESILWLPLYPWPHGEEELTKTLEIEREKLQLLTSQENSYKNIIYLIEKYRVPGVNVKDTQKIQAEKYRILGIDVMDMKMKLIECQGRKKKIELEIEALEKDLQQKIKHRLRNMRR